MHSLSKLYIAGFELFFSFYRLRFQVSTSARPVRLLETSVLSDPDGDQYNERSVSSVDTTCIMPIYAIDIPAGYYIAGIEVEPCLFRSDLTVKKPIGPLLDGNAIPSRAKINHRSLASNKHN